MRPQYDVFNGDADGLCALIQLRLAEPVESILITGVKRDIALVQQVPTDQPSTVTVLDISLDKNRDAVDAQLAAGSEVFYVDHHFAGEGLPQHDRFEGLIDTDALTCTSLLVDRKLQGRFRNWAITAAFGDNLIAVAKQLAEQAELTAEQTSALNIFGTCLNYNGYGASVDDLHFHPADLYRQLKIYDDPLDFIQSNSPTWLQLHQGYQTDLSLGLKTKALVNQDGIYIVSLPNEKWSRRVSGVLGNDLANARPDSACAVLTEIDADHYMVSVRAPLNNRTGADELVRQFPTGGGRKAAAGINRLPKLDLDRFIEAMAGQWRK
ncbi:MAG: DHH family phosphoesterase [Motiliproteus sp.]